MVYVVMENRKHDLAQARRFGELTALLPENEGVLLSAGPVILRLRKALRGFNDDDFLLLSGDPVAIGIATTIAAEANCGHVKLLKWKRVRRPESEETDGFYFPIDLNFNLRGDGPEIVYRAPKLRPAA